MSRTCYILVSFAAWSKMQTNKFLSPVNPNDEDFDAFDLPMDNWMIEQMRNRLPHSAFHSTIESNGAHFMFPNKENIYTPFSKGLVLLEVEVKAENLIYFDDNDYVMVVNNICNGWKKDFLASSQEEADEQINASPTVVEKSWLRMFDISRKRDVEYVGVLQLRAMTPYISFEMVRSVSVM